MAAKKNPLSDKAYELYKSGMKLVDIADQLGCSPATIRTWKNRYQWDADGNETFQKRNETKRNVSKKSKSNISWVKMEHEYVTDIKKTPCTLEELAIKYQVAIGTVEKYSMEHKWSEKRKKYKESIKQKALEKASDADADRIAHLLSIADKASDKAEQALEELEQYVVKNRRKVRKVEYKDTAAFGKPTKEVVDEKEDIAVVQGPIDRLGLSQITGALKNLKELYAITGSVEKQKAEIALLRAKVQTDEGDVAADDGFIEALQGTAQEDWSDEEG